MYSKVTTLFLRRKYTPTTSTLVCETRRDFRACARSATHDVVALFTDVRVADDAHVPPTPNSIEAAVRDADGEREDASRPLLVIGLRCDASERLRADSQAWADSINLDAERSKHLYVEHWHVDRQLGIDVLGHSDVSPHRIVTECPKPAKDLPLMRLSDPVARWLGAREHNIVVEERNDPDIGLSLYYRRIVAHGQDS